MEMKDQQAYEQAARVLPIRLRQEALSLSPTDRGRAEELRKLDEKIQEVNWTTDLLFLEEK